MDIQFSSAKYVDVMSGIRGVLCEAVRTLNELEINYVIIGGWSPYLRNNSNYPHPGTKDIDILFHDGELEKGLERVLERFLEQGYIVSAKYDFQLFRIINICDKPFVVGLDILHPSGTGRDIKKFVKHLDFGIPIDIARQIRIHKMMQSFVLPGAQLLFKDFHSPQTLKGILPDGNEFQGEFPLLSTEGLIITRCDSIRTEKRQKDSYELFVSFRQDNAIEIINRMKMHCKKYKQVEMKLKDTIVWLKQPENTEMVDKNISTIFNDIRRKEEHNSAMIPNNPSSAILESFAAMLS